MKISEAQKLYRAYGQNLQSETKRLTDERDEAKKQYEKTGNTAFSEQAATLQLSIDDNQKKVEDNRKVLEDLALQYAAAWNMEAEKQMADPDTGIAAEMGKIMTVFRRISHGDIVPYTDEKKLMEYSDKLYQMAKHAQMMAQLEKRKKYDSLWDDEEQKKYDPQAAADNAEVQGTLPEIPDEVENVSVDSQISSQEVELNRNEE